MNLWNEAFGDLNRLELDDENLTVDQRLKLAEVKALLAIGHELSLIQDTGINPEWTRRSHE